MLHIIYISILLSLYFFLKRKVTLKKKIIKAHEETLYSLSSDKNREAYWKKLYYNELKKNSNRKG